jgi:hypothetical protein
VLYSYSGYVTEQIATHVYNVKLINGIQGVYSGGPAGFALYFFFFEPGN